MIDCWQMYIDVWPKSIDPQLGKSNLRLLDIKSRVETIVYRPIKCDESSARNVICLLMNDSSVWHAMDLRKQIVNSLQVTVYAWQENLDTWHDFVVEWWDSLHACLVKSFVDCVQLTKYSWYHTVKVFECMASSCWQLIHDKRLLKKTKDYGPVDVDFFLHVECRHLNNNCWTMTLLYRTPVVTFVNRDTGFLPRTVEFSRDILHHWYGTVHNQLSTCGHWIVSKDWRCKVVHSLSRDCRILTGDSWCFMWICMDSWHNNQ